jgi:transcription-repair coupling factor (superfamily II helicase)
VRKIVKQRPFPTHSVLGILHERLRSQSEIILTGLQGASSSLLASILLASQNETVIAVLPTEREARNFYRDCQAFSNETDVLPYPAWNILAADFFTIQRDIELSRAHTLSALLTEQPYLVITCLSALMQKIIPRNVFTDYTRVLSLGDMLDRDHLSRHLAKGGYTKRTLVETKGEFSARGNIIDVYPPNAAHPFRIELMGDEVESIRPFDPASQRSSHEVMDLQIIPARELVLNDRRKREAIRNIRIRANTLELPRQIRDNLTETVEQDMLSSLNPMYLSLFYATEDNPAEPDESGHPLDTFFDYCSGRELFFIDHASSLERSFREIENTVNRLVFQARQENKFFVEAESFYLAPPDLIKLMSSFRQIRHETLRIDTGPFSATDPGTSSHLLFQTEKTGLLKKDGPFAAEGLLAPLVEIIRENLGDGYLVVFLCPGKEELARMAHLVEGYGLIPEAKDPAIPFLDLVMNHRPPGRLVLMEGKASGGFLFPELHLVVISEEDIFGRKQAKRLARPSREGYFLRSFGELTEGDFIVHKEHGIGIYRGLQKMSVAEIENDFLLIEYAEQDRLYIPVDRLDQIQRYIGPDGYTPRLERLGGASWETVKERVRKSIRDIAEELVSIYAAREVVERPSFSPPDRLYEEFCAAFEYEETPDQIRAIEDIHGDMAQEKPMDRLICGDAGFGKTEVALRASFRAAMDGRQVAVLVPTTILAEQHYQTFIRRLKDYPLRVEVLNRLKTRKEQEAIVKAVNRGTVDIIIGTHRILQKDLTFRDLGLVIVDEEQRFGVTHKERLKKIRTLVDVLTLSATPIPRTLHLSLVGIRDLSIINSPPENRQPIRTHVLEFNEDTIREAIGQELNRRGQVFFLHDRIRSIFSMARFLENLVPEANIGVVHGRMKPGEIEKTMATFIKGDLDILVCTTIVASGVDIPSANTMIINRADRLGLSQLYQIRGRVGRSGEESYAYLLIPRGAMLSREAQKRLQTLMDFSEPGSGFRIASNDLEIRGTGNLLGTSQSGHVSAVGYELYTELMEKTIRELKGEQFPQEEIRVEIHLGVPAYIPEDYMEDEHRRLLTYKRISLARTQEEIREIRDELTDCYGFIPPELDNLLRTIPLRYRLETLKSHKMTCGDHYMTVQFSPDSPVDPAQILLLSQTKIKGTKLTPELKLYIPLPKSEDGDRIRFAETVLDVLIPQPGSATKEEK